MKVKTKKPLQIHKRAVQKDERINKILIDISWIMCISFRQEALRQAERERRKKYKAQNEEREVVRVAIREKVRLQLIFLAPTSSFPQAVVIKLFRA